MRHQRTKRYKLLKELNTIDEFLRSRNRHPVLTLKLFKDVCKRVKHLEKRLDREHARKRK